MWKKTLIFLFTIMLLFLRNLCFPSNEIVISDEKYVDPLEAYEREVLERVNDLIFDDGFCNRPRRIGRGNKIIFWGLDNSIVKKSEGKYSFSLRNARFIIFKKDLSTGRETKFIIPGLGFRKMETTPCLYSSEDGSKVAYVPLDSENKLWILLTDNLEVLDVDLPCEEVKRMVWAPKGDKLAVITKDGIYISDMSGKESLKVYSTTYFSYPEYFYWLSDDQMLFVSEGHLYRLGLGEEIVSIFPVPEPFRQLNLYPSPDGSKIILGWESSGFPSECQIRLINLKGKVIEGLAYFTKEMPRGTEEYESGWVDILWAPDGRKFVYSPRVMKRTPSGVYAGSPAMLRLRILEEKTDIRLVNGEVWPIEWLDNNRLIYTENGERRVLTLKEE